VSINGEVKIRLAFPTLLYSMLEFVTFAVGVSIVFLLSKALAIRPKSIAIAEPKKEATLAIIVYVVLFVMAFAWFALSSMFQLQPFRFPFDITQAWVLTLLEGTSLLIIIVAMKSTRQKLGTIGVNKTDMGKIPVSLLLGYIMLKSQNIIPSSIFHVFVDWSIYLWQIS